MTEYRNRYVRLSLKNSKENYMLKVSQKSLEWAIQSIKKYSDTYIFPTPFEYEAIFSDSQNVINYLRRQDFHQVGIREHRTMLTPKSVNGFRISTQMDPLDSIRSLAVLYEIAREIENKRVPKSRKIVFSFRLKPKNNGRLYDPKYTWESYRKKALEIAETGQYAYVLLTDIAVFYPSIYLHYIETVLHEALNGTGKQGHAKFLIDIIRAMNLNQTHKGIPVGPQFSRPIAELILDDIDRALISSRTKYLRYVDDIVIFGKSKSDAFKNLTELAQLLYDRRHLKLSELKTRIISIDDFIEKFKPPQATEARELMDHWNELLEDIGLSTDPYEPLEPDDLDEDDWERLQSVNLEKVLNQELRKDLPDTQLISFLLAHLARTDNTDIADILLNEEYIAKLFPRLHTIINYLERVRSFSYEQRKDIGAKVLNLTTKSFVGQIEFNRIWLLSLFITSIEWNNENRFKVLLNKYSDASTQRKLYLALARANAIDYFRANKSRNLNMDSWLRRAFILGMSCLPTPERNPWFKSRSLQSRDFLDEVIENWCRNGLPYWSK